MIESINQIRAIPNLQISTQRKAALAIFSFFLGALFGFLAKYFDNLPYIGAIGTSLGAWIMIATLLAAWSRSPKAAALHVFLFFVALLVVYYLYSMVLFGFFPKYYFFAWGEIALLSPLGASIVWYARGNGWIAAFCASLPIGLLLVEGHSFFYTRSIPQGFDVLAAIVLTVILGNTGSQRIRMLLTAVVVFLVFWKLHILSLVFGGL